MGGEFSVESTTKGSSLYKVKEHMFLIDTRGFDDTEIGTNDNETILEILKLFLRNGTLIHTINGILYI